MTFLWIIWLWMIQIENNLLHFKLRFKYSKETAVIECRIIGNRRQIVHLLFISPINCKGHPEALSVNIISFFIVSTTRCVRKRTIDYISLVNQCTHSLFRHLTFELIFEFHIWIWSNRYIEQKSSAVNLWVLIVKSFCSFVCVSVCQSFIVSIDIKMYIDVPKIGMKTFGWTNSI